jgi:hypothetical protein
MSRYERAPVIGDADENSSDSGVRASRFKFMPGGLR